MRRIDLNLVRPFGPHLFQSLFGMGEGSGVFDVSEADRNSGRVAISQWNDEQIRYAIGRGLGRARVVMWTDFMVCVRTRMMLEG
jgi:hypothetical protein